ncbi:hypothetical protein JZ751_019830 [Albula glossodonta]|uniref:Secreted frizzled-related protein 1 n=1 Tax=Albula glossodonta TaxID=121402 RepID=A0A8T2NN73_9TELE|nr:hypothetical protein JZ751_019830 [Albula glossodonta]
MTRLPGRVLLLLQTSLILPHSRVQGGRVNQGQALVQPHHPALKMKIKEVKKEKGDRKLVAAQKKKKVLKMGALRKKDLKKLVLYIKNGADCPCAQLDSLSSNFLIMGRKVDQQLLLMAIHKWEKKSKELKFAIKYMKSHQCPTYHTVFQ